MTRSPAHGPLRVCRGLASKSIHWYVPHVEGTPRIRCSVVQASQRCAADACAADSSDRSPYLSLNKITQCGWMRRRITRPLNLSEPDTAESVPRKACSKGHCRRQCSHAGPLACVAARFPMAKAHTGHLHGDRDGGEPSLMKSISHSASRSVGRYYGLGERTDLRLPYGDTTLRRRLWTHPRWQISVHERYDVVHSVNAG
ncbi:hypothetical protein PYCCODRAFT_405564 [Trametes coccinea BRFM310]|uniref:Uncharacterized protein n=1 Tax=Trametes coccinea (strain BRFM310) TaxID=1353009 RepID=A0A1Y2IMZ1_TRAC3|nr:hypothetical protein PYCCODRAFT_405564 [Trametes coccinea BRFM310]